MKWIMDNWSFLAVVAMLAVYFVFSGKQSVKEWLLYAVSMAEKELGGGTGKLKLRQVYDAFISNYPVFSKIIPFSVFSLWVDEVLKEMRKIIENNKNIRSYIEETDNE